MMWQSYIKKILILIFAVLFHLISFGADIISLLPDTASYQDMKVLIKPVVYEGNDLFTMIDGGADLYLEYGFIRAVNVSYLEQETTRIDIQLYEMADEGAAYGVFSNSCSESDSILLIDPLIFIRDQYAMFYKNRYFGVISFSGAGQSLQTSLVGLAKEMAVKFPDETKLPELVQRALKAGYSFNQIKYIRGKIALSASYFFSHKDIFNLKEAVCLASDSSMIFVFQYDTDSDASSQLSSLKEEFEASTRITELSADESQIQFIDRKKRHVLIAPKGKYIMAIISPDNPAVIFQSFIKNF